MRKESTFLNWCQSHLLISFVPLVGEGGILTSLALTFSLSRLISISLQVISISLSISFEFILYCLSLHLLKCFCSLIFFPSTPPPVTHTGCINTNNNESGFLWRSVQKTISILFTQKFSEKERNPIFIVLVWRSQNINDWQLCRSKC